MIGSGSIDTRTFKQKFGERCFCGKNWSDPGRCGDPDPNYTIQNQLGRLFADRVKNCEICDRSIPASRRFCYDCSASRERERNRRDRHHQVQDTCSKCGATYEKRSDKKDRTLCFSCSRRKMVCKRGHNIAEVGRTRGDCNQCRRDRQR